MKKIYIGYVPKGEHMRETLEHWNTKSLMMFSKKQFREVQSQYPDELHVKRTVTITVEDAEI